MIKLILTRAKACRDRDFFLSGDIIQLTVLAVSCPGLAGEAESNPALTAYLTLASSLPKRRFMQASVLEGMTSPIKILWRFSDSWSRICAKFERQGDEARISTA